LHCDRQGTRGPPDAVDWGAGPTDRCHEGS